MTDDPRDLALDLMVTSARVVRHIRRHSGSGDTSATWRALACLDERGPMRVSEFAHVDQLSQPAATAKLNKLATAGLAQRMSDASDGRACLYGLTDEGRAHLARLRDSNLTSMLPQLEALSEARRAELAGALATVRHILDTAPDQG